MRIGDVLLRKNGSTATKWPLGRITAVHPGGDTCNIIHVVTVKTAIGTYRTPITKFAWLLPVD